MERHDTNDQQSLPRIRTLEITDLSVVMSFDLCSRPDEKSAASCHTQEHFPDTE
jgi:hypothetical protein